MKFKRHEQNPNYISWWCPGCDEPHMIPVKPETKGWTLSGTDEKPTLMPSVLVHSHQGFDRKMRIKTFPLCHVFIRDGQIEFLHDCGHELAGKTVDLPDWPPPEPELPEAA